VGGWRGGLRHHPDFLKLWVGETISLLGSQVTLLALPLTAILTLHANAAQMGYLTAAETAPSLLVGLVAGAWIDRLRRRPIMIGVNLGRFALLLSIPLLAVSGRLSMHVLYPIAFLVGTLMVWFNVAYQAFFPSLVGREHLIEGNTRLEVSASGAQIAGPGLAGLLVGLVTAPLAIAADAASFLASALCLVAIRTPEPSPIAREPAGSVWRDVVEGLRAVLGNPVLRAIAGGTGTLNFFGAAADALVVLYLSRQLGLGPVLLGVIFAAGNVGFLAGALLSGWLPGRIGLGPTIVWSLPIGGFGALLVPLAGGPLLPVVGLLVLGRVLVGFGGAIYNVHQVSLRQRITPDRLQGRMNASMWVLVWGTLPLGGLLGGALGGTLGLRATLALLAVGQMLAVLWVWRSPVRRLREHPAPIDDGTIEPAIP